MRPRKTEKSGSGDLWREITNCLDAFDAQECRNYFQNAGYASNQS